MMDLQHSSYKIKIKRLVVGPLCCNCYILAGRDVAAVIDPGDEEGRIIEEIEKCKLAPKWIINTHAHPDHIGANKALKKHFGAKVLMHASEKVILPAKEEVDIFIDEDTCIQIDEWKMTFLHTPGHTPGSVCIRVQEVLFSGDTLFEGGVGRTDLPFGSWEKLLSSLQLLCTLPEQTIVYPGHGESTTIQREKRQNPYLKGS